MRWRSSLNGMPIRLLSLGLMWALVLNGQMVRIGAESVMLFAFLSFLFLMGCYPFKRKKKSNRHTNKKKIKKRIQLLILANGRYSFNLKVRYGQESCTLVIFKQFSYRFYNNINPTYFNPYDKKLSKRKGFHYLISGLYGKLTLHTSAIST